jgi:hypothetical protein
MSNQVVIPFPHRRPSEVPIIAPSPARPRRAKMLTRLSTARGILTAVIETLSYMGDARVKRPLLSAPSLPVTR